MESPMLSVLPSAASVGGGKRRRADACAQPDVNAFIEGLERRLAQSERKCEQLQQEANEQRLEHLAEVHKLEKRLTASERARRDAQISFTDKTQARAEVARARTVQDRQALADDQARLRSLEGDLARQSEEIQKARASLEHDRRCFESTRRSEPDVSGGLVQPGSVESLEAETRSLRQQVAAGKRAERRLSAEVRKLQQARTNSEAQKGEVEALTAKLARARAAHAAQASAEAQRDQLVARARRWDTAFKEIMAEFEGSSATSRSCASPLAAGSDNGTAQKDSRIPPCVADAALELLRSLQMERAVLLERQGREEKAKAEAEADLARRTADAERARRELRDLTDSRRELEDKLLAAEKKRIFLARDRDNFKALVASYEKELSALATMSPVDPVDPVDRASAPAPESAPTPPSSKCFAELRVREAQAQQRAKTFEASLRATEERLAALEAAQSDMAAPTVLAESRKRVAEAEAEVRRLQAEVDRLGKHLVGRDREVESLEAQLGRGCFQRSTTKVLHLVTNPTRSRLKLKKEQTQAELDRLRTEVLKLRAAAAAGGGVGGGTSGAAGGAECGVTSGQLHAAEDDSGAVGVDGSSVISVPPGVSTSATSAGTGTATTGAADSAAGGGGSGADFAVLRQRMKLMFHNKIRSFRQAIYLLTGYMIDMTGGDKLRLRSMFAEREDDVLLFQLIDDGEGIELLETDFVKRIDKGVFSYLTACRSVPAFLSTLTVNLFEKQTFIGN